MPLGYRRSTETLPGADHRHKDGRAQLTGAGGGTTVVVLEVVVEVLVVLDDEVVLDGFTEVEVDEDEVVEELVEVVDPRFVPSSVG